MDWVHEVKHRYSDKIELEWERLLATPFTRIEYLITKYCLEKYLPTSGSILDAGSGPGRYSIQLANQAYSVFMFDLVMDMLCFGKQKAAQFGTGDPLSMTNGNLVALPYADASFDAVISLGAPISHIPDNALHGAVIAELARVLKPGGILLVTGLQKMACYRGMVFWNIQEFITSSPQDSIIDGTHVWYLFSPDELQSRVRDAGLTIADTVGCQGLGCYLPLENLEIVEADPERWPIWATLLLETCNEPSILGISNHLLVVARKPGN